MAPSNRGPVAVAFGNVPVADVCIQSARKSTIVIRLASPGDVPDVMETVARCVSAMQAQGIDQWDEGYPSAEMLREDIRAKILLVAEREGVIVGAVYLNDAQPEQYGSVPWRCPDDHPLVDHRLCVHPEHQGQGIGRRLMDSTETHACGHGFRSIRLEVYPTASAALALYSRLGDAPVGAARFAGG